MSKQKVIFQDGEARAKLKQGVDLVANIIKTTLGPKGRNVIVKNLGPLPPRSMNDGYYIADHIQHKDPTINAGVDMVKEICKKTNDVAGDGTTTTAILSQVLIEEGLKAVEDGKNPVDLKKELEADLKIATDRLKMLSRPVDNPDDIEYIATISGNNDQSIGKSIREIYEKVGKNAAIIVEKSAESDIRTETVKGIYFDRGYDEARGFVNNPGKMTAEYRDVIVACIDDKLEYLEDIQPFVEKLIKYYEDNGKSPWDIRLLIIANEIPLRMDAINFLAENNKAAITKLTEGSIPLGFFCVAVQAPEFGPTRSEIIEDIAIATGGVCISKANGLTIRTAEPQKVLGRAEKIIVASNATTILGGNANKEELQKRIDMIKGEMEQLSVNAKITREKFEKRLNVIESGVGIIYAGGSTEVESKERHLRIEDAVLASRAAIDEGVVTGGGMTYLRISEDIESILAVACQKIVWQVAENAGKDGQEILTRCATGHEEGYNALTDKFEDLDKAGVLDSAKVIRVALENAVSLASLFLTTSASVIEFIEEEEKK